MAKGRWIGLDEYYNELGYEVYGDDWNGSYIDQLEKHEGRDIRSDTYKKASEIRKIFYRRIWEDLKDIQAKPRSEQPYAPVSFTIEEWFIKRSQCVDAQGNVMKCQIFVPEKETRGANTKHNREELLCYLEDVAKLVRGKISYRSIADNYAIFLKDKPIKSPSKSWVERCISDEVKKLKDRYNP